VLVTAELLVVIVVVIPSISTKPVLTIRIPTFVVEFVVRVKSVAPDGPDAITESPSPTIGLSEVAVALGRKLINPVLLAFRIIKGGVADAPETTDWTMLLVAFIRAVVPLIVTELVGASIRIPTALVLHDVNTNFDVPLPNVEKIALSPP
jgi:hypothetical protein